MAILDALPLSVSTASSCSALAHQQLPPGPGCDAAPSPLPPSRVPATPATIFPAAAVAAAAGRSTICSAGRRRCNRQRTPRRAPADVNPVAAAAAVDIVDALAGRGANRQQCRASRADSSRPAGARMRRDPISSTVWFDAPLSLHLTC